MSFNNKESNLNFIRHVVNLKRSQLAYLILCLAILPRVIWMIRDTIPSQPIFNLDLNFLISDFTNQLGLINTKLLNVFSIAWIFIVISIFEFVRSKNLNTLSLNRLKNSEGTRYADLLYYFLIMLGKKLKFLNIIGTLGLARISNSFNSFLESSYSFLMPNQFFSSPIALYLLLFLGIILIEFAEYVSHKLSHDYIWELHEFHHSATEMTILNIFRSSILESEILHFIKFPFYALALLIINRTIEQGQWLIFVCWILFGLAGELFGYVGHSSVKLIFPKPFSLLFMSPSLHWIHHSNNPDHWNKNFGRILTCWDKLFGTYLDETHLKEIENFGFGVENSDYNKYNPLYSFYILPVKKFTKKIRKLLLS